MPREGQNRLSWDRFDGGVEQAPERAQPGQVLDARNIWAPDGLPERRPGTRFIIAAGDVDTRNPTDITFVIVDNGDGTFTYTMTVVAGTQGSPIPAGALLAYWSFPAVGDAADGPFIEWTQVSGPAKDKMVFDENRVYTGTWPTNTALVQNNAQYYFAGRTTPFLLAEVQLGGAKRLLMVYEWFQASSGQWILTIDVPFTFREVRGSFDFEVDDITPTSSRISTYVELPGLDLVWVTYNRTIYEIARSTVPGPPMRIEEATVNTDPDFVGPRLGPDADGNFLTPPYSVDVLAQLSSPPRAGIIVYAVGHIFALDMADEPFNLRWTAAVSQGGYNIWPAVNFEPMDEDGGKPLAAKPLHEFLVVYQKQNIYALINDGIDPITGQATFDPKRVVSGVGALSHNGVIPAQGRHLFPALDGFYAFDGTPNVAKLSQPIDKFYGRLGFSSLSKCRGVHWPEKHCVMWTMPQSGAPNPRALNEEQHYLVLFDYTAQGGRGAWWIWDGIRGGGGLTRMFAGNVIPGIYIMSSLSLISRLTGNADITDQNSIFFEATQPALSELPASFILTHRLGEPIFSTFTAEELWVEAPTQASTVGVTIIASDDDNLTAADKPVDMTSEGDVLWDDTTWGGGTWQANKRRERPAGAAIVAKHFQLKIYAVNALNRAWRFVRAALFSEKRFGRW